MGGGCGGGVGAPPAHAQRKLFKNGGLGRPLDGFVMLISH